MVFITPLFNANKTVGRVKHMFNIKIQKLDVVLILQYILIKCKRNNHKFTEIRVSDLDKLSVHYVEIIMALISDEVLKIIDQTNDYKFKIQFTEPYQVGEQNVKLTVEDDRKIKEIRQLNK